MEKSIVGEKSFRFAIRIVNLYKFLCGNKKEYVLSKQLLRSGTSIGANVQEGLQGQSKRNFLMKMNIALKETSETKYWLRLLKATDDLTEREQKSIFEDCTEIEKILTKIVKTTDKTVNKK